MTVKVIKETYENYTLANLDNSGRKEFESFDDALKAFVDELDIKYMVPNNDERKKFGSFDNAYKIFVNQLYLDSVGSTSKLTFEIVRTISSLAVYANVARENYTSLAVYANVARENYTTFTTCHHLGGVSLDNLKSVDQFDMVEEAIHKFIKKINDKL